jgi:segregation and condensation protein A
VSLRDFEGPFDLLLALISRRKVEVTEVALHEVTDEFLAYIRAQGPHWDLDEATEFLVVAATLLDLKAARLLPSGEVEDDADLELLEARDLLFARLLQYRAFKAVAAQVEALLASAARRVPRSVGLEPRFAQLLPDVVLSLTAEDFAALAVAAMAPREAPAVAVEHLHAPAVSVREQAAVVVSQLRSRGGATFRSLAAGAGTRLEVVARFLAVLELYRDGCVVFDQAVGLGELHIRWVGGESDVDTSRYDTEGPEGGPATQTAAEATAVSRERTPHAGHG